MGEANWIMRNMLGAAMYYNPGLLLATLDKIQIPGMAGGVFGHFVQQWIHDTDCFIGLHDRKLCVLGLVHLMQMADNPAVQMHAQQIVPSALSSPGSLLGTRGNAYGKLTTKAQSICLPRFEWQLEELLLP